MTFLTSDATKHTKWWKKLCPHDFEIKEPLQIQASYIFNSHQVFTQIIAIYFLLDLQYFALRDREKNTWRVWLVVTVRFYFSIFQNFWFLFKFDCRKSKMCKFTTKARLHFFSSYNQIIPPDEMKTERKNSIKKKGERQKKRILNRREKLPTDTKMKGN